MDDGRYVYFVPFHDGTDFHGRVLRYDTQGDFNTLARDAATFLGDVISLG